MVCTAVLAMIEGPWINEVLRLAYTLEMMIQVT